MPELGAGQRSITIESSPLTQNPVQAGANKRIFQLDTRKADLRESTNAAGESVILSACEENCAKTG